MAQFVAFEEGVEVNGQTILSHIKALDVGQELRSEILRAHGIDNPQPGRWYSQQSWLNAFKELYESAGDQILFNIGQAIPAHALFPPPGTDNLEKALKSIDKAYQKHHRGGEIGSYRLIMFSEKERKAIMFCQTPYPSELDRGIISKLVQDYRPDSSGNYAVELDREKSSRKKGHHNCTYNIYW